MGQPCMAPTRRPWTISMLWRRSAGAFFFGSKGAGKEEFDSKTVLDDFSAGGLSMRVTWRVAVGAKLFAIVRLTTDSFSWEAAPCVAVHGVVRRVESQPDGKYRVGVAFTHHRFL